MGLAAWILVSTMAAGAARQDALVPGAAWTAGQSVTMLGHMSAAPALISAPAASAASGYTALRYNLPRMIRSSHPSSQLPLSVPVFQILISLADRDLHGYAIIQDVVTRTEGEVRLTASTLYAASRRMLDAGMIDEVDDPRRAPAGDDERRRYYRMTPYGREVAGLEAARLERAAAMARAKRLLPRRSRA